jgi:hypothetical protein
MSKAERREEKRREEKRREEKRREEQTAPTPILFSKRVTRQSARQGLRASVPP